MSSASEIKNLAMKLPKRSRLKLAVDLLSSATPAVTHDELLQEVIRRDADIKGGNATPLDEVEFWAEIRSRRA